MPIIRSQLQPECVSRLISQEVESSSLQDVVFLCEDGMLGFTRCLLSPSPLLLELIPPPGSSCCEQLLRAGEAKVHLSLDGVKVMDLQKVLGFLTGVKQQMTSESLEVAAMMGFTLRTEKEIPSSQSINHLVNQLLDETIEKTLTEVLQEVSNGDELEEELEYIFTGNDCVLDEISLYPRNMVNEVESEVIEKDIDENSLATEESSKDPVQIEAVSASGTAQESIEGVEGDAGDVPMELGDKTTEVCKPAELKVTSAMEKESVIPPAPHVLESIEELNDTQKENADKTENSIDETIDADDDDEIVFKDDPQERGKEILDEDTMPEFEYNQALSATKTADEKKEDLGETEDEYDPNDDYGYEEDEDYDEEITKLQNQINSIITNNAAKKGLSSARTKKRAREESDDHENVRDKRGKVDELSCHLCQKSVKSVPDYLQHLSRSHHSKELYSKYPLSDGENCPLCLEENKEKVFVYKKVQRSNYTLHIGKNHFRVLQFVTEEIRENLIQQLLESAGQVHSKEFSFLQTENEEQQNRKIDAVTSVDETTATPNEEEAQKDAKTNEVTNLVNVIETKQREKPNNSLLELEENCTGDPEPVVESKAKTKRRKSVGSASTAKCLFCDDDSEYPRWKLMTHLTKHFAQELSKVYINESFVPNEKCSLCLQEDRSQPLVMTTKAAYIRHVGASHDKVLDFLPPQHVQQYKCLVREERAEKSDENVLESSTAVDKKSEPSKDKTLSNKSVDQESVGPLKDKKKRKKSVGKESTKTRKTPEERDMKKEENDAPAVVLKGKSSIPVLKDTKIANPVPKSKLQSSKASSLPVLQCGECPASVRTKPELFKHMKGHINK